MEILELDADAAMEEIRWIRWLLMQFSPESEKKVNSGELDTLILETIQSPQTLVCMASDGSPHGPAALYVATFKPTLLHKVLYIDSVVVSMSYRGNRVLEHYLFPHMKDLARRNFCSVIELTSSNVHVQKLYQQIGFIGGLTTNFRFYV